MKLGAEYSSNPDAFGLAGANGATALASLLSKSSPTATTNINSPRSFNLITSANITFLLDLLVTKANAKILNQPTLWTRDNEEATFFKGKSVPFTTATQSDTSGNSINNSVEYRGVGVTLRVRPNITPEKAVDMTLNLMVSQLESSGTNNTPITSLLDTTTKAIIADGQTIMIGGIVFQTDTETINKIPLLGDIPILGALFRHVDSQKTNNELIVFITPFVMDSTTAADSATMVKQTEALKKKADTKKDLQKSLGLDANDVPLN
jgi:general secretion pathway protein D